ncbi:MAG: exodeoxyribonuclease VII large subunit [Anaerolineae bacterium]|nr:exodeoxyribonuclease VII large subunit [Anaerolineae bacterium]
MWDQPSLFTHADHPLTVSEVTSRIRAVIEGDPVFQSLWVQGEVSNLTRASSGHVYLTLKDSGAQISAVIWRSQAQAMLTLPGAGDQVVVHGRIGVYEQGGRYQLYVDLVQPAGRGSLYQEFERLKAQLEAEGLFDESRKRPLPSYPGCIGVVTSPTGAALRDVLNVLTRRYPLARVLVSPTMVQGEAAPAQIVTALARLNACEEVDVILLVRGGGSLEDLWAFNDERVARAIAASRLPVISGVGHETDFTLADFAADRRAPTPSAAAEIATPDVVDLRVALLQAETRLWRAAMQQTRVRREQLGHLRRTLQFLSPAVRLTGARQRVDDLASRLEMAIGHRLDSAKREVVGLQARLGALNPDAVLSRGYAIVRRRDTGDVVTSVTGVTPGAPLSLRFRDGEAAATVDS